MWYVNLLIAQFSRRLSMLALFSRVIYNIEKSMGSVIKVLVQVQNGGTGGRSRVPHECSSGAA